jgi:hypothetical protein
MCKPHRLKQKLRSRTLKEKALTIFPSTYCLRFHQLNWLQQTQNKIWFRKIETSCRPRSFEQKTKNRYIKHGTQDFLGASYWRPLPSLVGFGATLPYAQHVKGFGMFCEILVHQNSNPAKLSKRRLEISAWPPASAPNHPGPSFSVFFFRQTDRRRFSSARSMLKRPICCSTSFQAK